MKAIIEFQINELSNQITDQTLLLKIEIKYQNLFLLMARVNRYINERFLIIGAYDTNKIKLIYYLDQLIEDFRLANIENDLVNYIDFEFIGTESVIESYLALVETLNSHFCPIASSPHKMVYDFYLSLYNSVNECHAFLKLSYEIRAMINGGGEFPASIRYEKSFFNFFFDFSEQREEDEAYVNLRRESYNGLLFHSCDQSQQSQVGHPMRATSICKIFAIFT